MIQENVQIDFGYNEPAPSFTPIFQPRPTPQPIIPPSVGLPYFPVVNPAPSPVIPNVSNPIRINPVASPISPVAAAGDLKGGTISGNGLSASRVSGFAQAFYRGPSGLGRVSYVGPTASKAPVARIGPGVTLRDILGNITRSVRRRKPNER